MFDLAGLQAASPSADQTMPPDPGGGYQDQQAPTQMSPADNIRVAIEHAQAALAGEPDDADSQQLAKVVQGLYQILAARQKQQDQVMGMQPGLRRALGG